MLPAHGRWRIRWTVIAVGLALGPGRPAGSQVFEFREGASQGGQLKIINELPVLVVEGTPEVMGRQAAALTSEAVKRLEDFPRALVLLMGRQREWPKYVATARAIFEQAPSDHRRELEACAAALDVDRDKLIALNTVLDVYGGFGCSSLIVEGKRSATGSPLFGRNLDFNGIGVLQRFNLVVVYRPTGKHAFASIGFPGLFGVLSGMNDRGLALALHGVFTARDGSPGFDSEGMPCTLLYRRVLEECSTVEEAEKLLRESRHTTALSVVLCDRRGGAVAEVSPGGVAVRRGSDGICACTNHFRAGRRVPVDFCPRYAALARSSAVDQLSLADIARKLDEVNQGIETLQTMVFEPRPLRLHLAVGRCPSSALPLKKLELAGLLAGKAAGTDGAVVPSGPS